jgi:hypothetical protein
MRSSFVLALCSFTLVAIALAPRSTAAPTPAEKCLAKKLKEVGKYDLCRLKADAKGVTKSEPADYSKCTQKLTLKWGAIDGAGGCDFPGDQAASHALACMCIQEWFKG